MFSEAMAEQTRLMEALARRLDERGYALLIHGQNRDGNNGAFLYRYFGGGVPNYLLEIGKAQHINPVIVHVFPTPADPKNPPSFSSQKSALRFPFSWRCQIRNLKRLAPITSALELMATTQEGRGYDAATRAKGNGVIRAIKMGDYTDYTEYGGRGRDTLEILVRVLDMPQHRMLLAGRA